MFINFLHPLNKQAGFPVTGRLKCFTSTWEKITQDPWVLQVVQGYQIEFMKPPVQLVPARMPSLTPTLETVLDQEVQELLNKEAVHLVKQPVVTEGFISSLFVVPKKDGGNRPVVNLKPLNQYITYEHFKMEGIHMLRDLLKLGDWLVKIDLKDAYLTVPIWINHQKYLRFLWKDSMLKFACLPFGLASAPRVFMKLMKPVVALLRQQGIRLIIYLDDILIMAESSNLELHQAASALNLLESLGFIVNYEKSHLVPTQEIEFLGLLVNSKNLTLILPGEKLRKIRKRCKQLLGISDLSIRELSKFLGLLTSSIQAIFPAPLHFRNLQRLKNQAMTAHQSYETMISLDQAAREEVIWWRDHLQAWNGKALFQKPVDLLIETDASKRLGGILPRYKYRGAMVLRRKASTHQLFGAAGRVIRNPDIYKRQSLRSCQTADGQRGSSSLYKQDGRNPLAGSFKSSCTTMGVVPPKQLGDICSTSIKTFKCQSRPGIQNITGFQQLETRPLDVSITSGEMGALGDRSLCIPADTSAPKVCQLETRSLSSAFRCIFNELERHSGVCLSPLCSDRALSTAGKDTECGTASSGGPSVASTDLVPTITTSVHRSSSVIPNITQTGDERQSVSPSGQPTTGWMETIRQRYDIAHISEATRNLLLAAWRKNTTSTYASAWSKWVGWCDRRQVNPLSAPLSLILEFLKDQFEEGKAYRSLNVYRSALSALLPEIDSFKVGSHPLVSQLLKGAFNLKPPKPRYSHTWSIGKVLDFIKSLGPSKDLDIKVLSYKLVVLLGLTAPDRSSDLAKRDLRFRSFHPEGVSFCLPGLTKTSKTRRFSKN